MDPNEQEQDIFSFVYKKNSSQKMAENTLISNEKNNLIETTSKSVPDQFNKNFDIVNPKKKGKKEKKKRSLSHKKAGKEKSEFQSNIEDEECNYLFTLLKDGNTNSITEITLRKALNNAGMTNVDDEFTKVNIFISYNNNNIKKKMINIFNETDEEEESLNAEIFKKIFLVSHFNIIICHS